MIKIDFNQNNIKLEQQTKIPLKKIDNEKEKNLLTEDFYFIKDIQNINQIIKSLLEPYIKKEETEFNISQAFERQRVQKDNFDINIRIKCYLKFFKVF